jgi:hypothetical protein
MDPARNAFFSEVFRLLIGQASACLVLIEDIHWADDATLHLIQYLGRRIHASHVLLVLTARDDQPESQSRLRRALADIPPMSRSTVGVPSLTRRAVTELAERRGINGDEVFRVTGGNAYFVTELLEEGDWKTMPGNLRDVILARADGLSAADRNVIAAASIFPDTAERLVINAMFDQNTDTSFQPCIDCGLVYPVAGGYHFATRLPARWSSNRSHTFRDAN